jgi:hypothetical protein
LVEESLGYRCLRLGIKTLFHNGLERPTIEWALCSNSKPTSLFQDQYENEEVKKQAKSLPFVNRICLEYVIMAKRAREKSQGATETREKRSERQKKGNTDEGSLPTIITDKNVAWEQK